MTNERMGRDRQSPAVVRAIVNTSVCAMYSTPGRENTVIDEVLYGMVVEILDQPVPGWYRIRTHYRYEGIVSADDLIVEEESTAIWEALPKKVILNKNCCDVLSVPKVQGWHLMQLTRGCRVALLGEPEEGWQKIRLADGRSGYVPSGILGTLYSAPVSNDEAQLRKALVDMAMLYQGTHYRWGGKSPMGIDCSGLCSMAYMLCGILIYRDANIVDGFPIHQISLDAVKPGDLLFFPGHVAMYIGDGRYCHCTAKSGVNGFTVNSLNPDDPDYRADLREKITQVGSYF